MPGHVCISIAFVHSISISDRSQIQWILHAPVFLSTTSSSSYPAHLLQIYRLLPSGSTDLSSFFLPPLQIYRLLPSGSIDNVFLNFRAGTGKDPEVFFGQGDTTVVPKGDFEDIMPILPLVMRRGGELTITTGKLTHCF